VRNWILAPDAQRGPIGRLHSNRTIATGSSGAISGGFDVPIARRGKCSVNPLTLPRFRFGSRGPSAHLRGFSATFRVVDPSLTRRYLVGDTGILRVYYGYTTGKVGMKQPRDGPRNSLVECLNGHPDPDLAGKGAHAATIVSCGCRDSLLRSGVWESFHVHFAKTASLSAGTEVIA
jgi:hypothetical protein